MEENEHISVFGMLRIIIDGLDRDPGILGVSLLSLGFIDMGEFLPSHH